jgi:hypothetical protein
MDEQRSTLPVGEYRRVLDRLLLLEQVIGRQQVRQILEDTGCLDSRRCPLSREVIFWLVLAMGLFTDLSYRQLFKICRRLWPGEATPTAPASVWPGNVGAWPRSAVCSNGSSTCSPRRKRREPFTTAGG